jgi:putative spermidine/putrescine transport system substrate-binding protein
VHKFPGARSLCIGDSQRNCTYALLADGVSADMVYPLDLDRAFKKLDQIKPHIKVWWREGNQSQQLLRDGEVDLMSIWNARGTELKQQGVPAEVVWNGAVRSASTWCVLKGAPGRKLAWEFIQFASAAKPQAEFNTRLYYGPTNPDAYALIPKDIAVQLPTYRDNLAVSIEENDVWEADRIAAIEERFTQWLAS